MRHVKPDRFFVYNISEEKVSELSFWEKHKGHAIGLVVALLFVASFLIPFRINIPNRSIDEGERNGYEFASITLTERNDDESVFSVHAVPCNFEVVATTNFNDDIDIGSDGLVAGYKELAFDGSYQYSYDFYFPKNGNLFQALCTLFGLINFNPPYRGHVEGKVSSLVEVGGAIVGDILYLGGYAWRVLDVVDGKVFVISENILMKRRFDDSTNVWESSEIRQYLNDDFMQAFNGAELEAICNTNLVDVGTTDKVFLLSFEEASKLLPDKEDRATTYDGQGWQWWLRTPGIFENPTHTAAVDYDGLCKTNGPFILIDENRCGVRPALWIMAGTPNWYRQSPSSGTAVLQ
jgi:hypothetical protein